MTLSGSSLPRHPSGTDLPHHDSLGPGVVHPEPWACASDVQPAPQAVWWPGWANSSAAQSLRHKRCVCPGHNGSTWVSGTDTFAAYCPDGPRRGTAHDPEHRVSEGVPLCALHASVDMEKKDDWWLLYYIILYLFSCQKCISFSFALVLICDCFLMCHQNLNCLIDSGKKKQKRYSDLCIFWKTIQEYHEQQGFLPAPQSDESSRYARDCHGGDGQCVGWRRRLKGKVCLVYLSYSDSTYRNKQNVSFCLFYLGDSIPSSGDQLLSFSLLLLSYQPTEPALHVWPSELPATEQWHWLRSVTDTYHTVCCVVHVFLF